MHEITIVALGPGSPELLTVGALDQLHKASRVLLRTGRHGAAVALKDRGIAFETLDKLYEASLDFDAFTQSAMERVLAMAQEGPLCYAVADPAQDESVRLILARVPDAEVLPGVAMASFALSAMPFISPVLVSCASGLKVTDAQRPVCLTEMNGRELAGDCKLKLLRYFDEDAAVLFFPPGETALKNPERITLEELDRQPAYDHTVSALILPGNLGDKRRYDLQDLIELMDRLRGPEGCPWDREQTHRSLSRYLVEEAFEAMQAISEEDWPHAEEELGDVLLQVIFHANIGEQYGTMDLGGMTSAVCRKLIARHRHVFGGDTCDTAGEVEDRWEQIKAQERGNPEVSEIMRGVPQGMSPLLRALKIQEKASQVGFDWDGPVPALKKVIEEVEEVLQSLDKGIDPMEETGDLFFACVNAARLMSVLPEEAVFQATEKFLKRFTRMEALAASEGKPLKGLTLPQLDVYWERSKKEMG